MQPSVVPTGIRPFDVGILFAAMLLGMVSKALWDAFEARRGRMHVKLDPYSLVKPALVSPIVFLLVWKATELERLDVMAVCFSYQNGFTWQALLGRTLVPLPSGD